MINRHRKRGRRTPGRAGNSQSLGSILEDYSENDFPFKEKMLEYIANIIEQHPIDAKMMEFVLLNMDISERRDFINFSYEGAIPTVHERGSVDNEYHHVMDEIHDPTHISEHIVTDIYHDKLYVRERDVKEYIAHHLRDQMCCYQRRNKRGFNNRINELRDIFNLDKTEIEALFFLYCMYESNTEYLKSYNRNDTFYDVLKLASSALREPLPGIKKILSKRGRLYLCGLLDDIDVSRSDYFDINDAITEYIAGVSDVSLLDQFVRPDRGECLDPASYSIDPEVVDTIVSLMSAPGRFNILLYGIAGTGKTEFARSVVRAAGKKAYFLQFGEGDMTKRGYKSRDNRHLALTVAVNSIDPDEGIIIADEADLMLNTAEFSPFANAFVSGSTTDKGSLNYFLDMSCAKIIWISNKIRNVEESSLRRFSYTLYFSEFSYRERINIWNNLLEKHPLRKFFPRKLIEDLSYRYRVNAGGIGSALDTLAVIYSSRKPDKKSVEAKLRDLLDRHEKITRGEYKKEREPFNDITPQYDPNAVNMDGDRDMAIAATTGFSRRMKEEEDLKNANVNLLFWGAPGTGKTEYARYLAQQSGLRLIVKRASDILSKWVGGTEENIAAAFREARDSRAILFIDEADTLLYSREEAMRSWEKSMTNEFLTQMENHTGILICCTNLLTSVDRAALRRFNFKFEFRPLTKEGKLLLYKKYFTVKGKRLTPAMKQHVMDIPDLTPGDFRAVQLRLGHVTKDSLTHEKIIAEFEVESRYKHADMKKKVGY